MHDPMNYIGAVTPQGNAELDRILRNPGGRAREQIASIGVLSASLPGIGKED